MEYKKDLDPILSLLYEGAKSVVDTLEEIEISKKISDKKIYNGSYEDILKHFLRIYSGKLSFTQRLTIKLMGELSWDVFSNIFYDFLLGLGRKEDGGYKKTKDTILDILKNYFGE